MFQLSDYDYELPDDRIACYPAEPRDSSRMMVFSRKQSRLVGDFIFRELPHFLRGDDLLVVNNSRVIPARIFGRKSETGAKIEIFILSFIDDGIMPLLSQVKG